MKTRTYQLALAAAIAICITFGAALAFVLLRHRFPVQPPAGVEDPVIARGPQPSSSPVPPSPVPANSALTGSGAALAPIQLSPQRLQEIGVTTAPVVSTSLNDNLNVPGNVDIDEEKLAYVQTRFPGWIQDVYANATYQYVRKGQRLFTVYSPDLVSSEQEYLLARQNQKAFAPDAHGMAEQEGGWLLQAADERLRQFGVPAQAITDLEQSGKVQRNMTIESPASGYITERNALPNAYVQPETKLYTIADLSTVWVYANVFQNAVGRLRPGDRGQVTVDAYPGRTFSGRIDQILPQVDPTTRTVRVRLIFRNPGVVLKPGMYVNVKMEVSLGRQLVIPASAVLQSGERAIAFVDHGQGYLEPRIVQTGPQVDDSIVVLGGLKAGEQVVTSANFLLDSEAQLQTALGGFAPPPPPTQPGAQAKKDPETQVQIDLSTQPSPPHQGSNAVQVKLTGADGKPVTGAQVMVTFFMPAMPAMGMAAQRVPVTLSEKESGLYGGLLQLPDGGTWKVSATVQRAGHTVAAKQLSIDVAGGM